MLKLKDNIEVTKHNLEIITCQIVYYKTFYCFNKSDVACGLSWTVGLVRVKQAACGGDEAV